MIFLSAIKTDQKGSHGYGHLSIYNKNDKCLFSVTLPYMEARNAMANAEMAIGSELCTQRRSSTVVGYTPDGEPITATRYTMNIDLS